MNFKLIFFLCFISSSSLATEKTGLSEILWLQSATPPFHLEKSEQTPVGGLCDNLVEQLIKNLPGIKHSRAIIPQKRIGKYLDEGKMACFPCMIHKKQTNSRATFSIPTTIYPAFNVITSKSNARRITQLHGLPVNLVSLLTDMRFIYGKSEARKFTNTLNQIALNTKSSKRASYSTSSDNESNVVIDRINREYIDYTIDYPFVAQYFKRFSKNTNLTALPIEGQQGQLVHGAIGCSTNAANNFATQAISQINHVLKNMILDSTEYQQSQHYWLHTTINDFTEQYQQQIINPLAIAD